MEEDIKPMDIGREDRQETRVDLPPSGSGAQTTGATAIGTKVATTTSTASPATPTATLCTAPTGATLLAYGRHPFAVRNPRTSDSPHHS